MQTFHPRLHNGALTAFETFEMAEFGQFEITLQLGFGIEHVGAVFAVAVAAVVIAQFGNQPGRFGKMAPYPRGKHGVAAGDVQP